MENMDNIIWKIWLTIFMVIDTACRIGGGLSGLPKPEVVANMG